MQKLNEVKDRKEACSPVGVANRAFARVATRLVLKWAADPPCSTVVSRGSRFVRHVTSMSDQRLASRPHRQAPSLSSDAVHTRTHSGVSGCVRAPRFLYTCLETFAETKNEIKAHVFCVSALTLARCTMHCSAISELDCRSRGVCVVLRLLLAHVRASRSSSLICSEKWLRFRRTRLLGNGNCCFSLYLFSLVTLSCQLYLQMCGKPLITECVSRDKSATFRLSSKFPCCAVITCSQVSVVVLFSA